MFCVRGNKSYENIEFRKLCKRSWILIPIVRGVITPERFLIGIIPNKSRSTFKSDHVTALIKMLKRKSLYPMRAAVNTNVHPKLEGKFKESRVDPRRKREKGGIVVSWQFPA
jgi:hypothetical protein